MAVMPKFNEANLQAIADILGDTGCGLTGALIGKYLRECGCRDPIPDMTKRHRLFAGLKAKQDADGCANGVLAFIKHAMNPVRHVGNPSRSTTRAQTMTITIFLMRVERHNDRITVCGAPLGFSYAAF